MRILSLLCGLAAITAATAKPLTPHHLLVQDVAPPTSSRGPYAQPTEAFPSFDDLARGHPQKTGAPETAAVGSAFGGKCRYITLGGSMKAGNSTLQGKCVDDDGHWWDTVLNLNECLGNERGRLIYDDMGNFDASCRPCTLETATPGTNMLLECNCLDGTGIPRYTSLEMGTNVGGALAIQPVDGRLTCGQREGDASLSLETPRVDE